MTVRLVVSILTQPGKSADQIDAFARLAPVVRAEPGCLQYDLHRVIDDPDRFVLLEAWESDAALLAHQGAPHMLEADAAKVEFRAAPAETVRLSPDPVG
jgi:quinol monooxygenase YgiN